MAKQESRHDLQARALVVVQFLTAAALVVCVRLPIRNWLAVATGVVGLLLGAWALATIGFGRVVISPNVQPRTELVTTGPYRFIRHPMYTALLLFSGGFIFLPLAWWKPIAWCLLSLVLVAKSRMEERQMRERFSQYASYAKRTWRFAPFLW